MAMGQITYLLESEIISVDVSYQFQGLKGIPINTYDARYWWFFFKIPVLNLNIVNMFLNKWDREPGPHQWRFMGAHGIGQHCINYHLYVNKRLCLPYAFP